MLIPIEFDCVYENTITFTLLTEDGPFSPALS